MKEFVFEDFSTELHEMTDLDAVDSDVIDGSSAQTGAACLIGFGYDCINSPYLVPLQAKLMNPIVDPAYVEEHVLRKRGFNEHCVQVGEASSCQETVYEFNRSLGVEVNTPYFSGGIEMEFGGSSSIKSTTFAYRYSAQSFCGTDYFQGEDYKKHLTAAFTTALETMEPSKLFTTYGTHLVIQAQTGGRLDMTVSSSSAEIANNSSQKTAAKAAVGEILSVSASKENRQSATSKLSGFKIYCRAIGGKSIAVTSLDSFSAAISDWHKSLENQDTHATCGINTMDQSLVPLWKLKELPAARVTQLKDYFYANIGERNFKLLKMPENTPAVGIATAKTYEEAFASTAKYKWTVFIGENLHTGNSEAEPAFLYNVNMRRVDIYTALVAVTGTSKEASKTIAAPKAKLNCMRGGHIAEFTENGQRKYVHLYMQERTANEPIVTQTRVLIGNEPVPHGWEFACHQGTQTKFNCNIGNPAAPPVYIIYKKD